MKHYQDAQVEEKIHTFLSKKLHKYPELTMEQFGRTVSAVPRTTTILTNFIWGLAQGR